MIAENGISFAGWNLSNKNETSSLIASGCGKVSGWEDDELSDTGKWLKSLIRQLSVFPQEDEISESETITLPKSLAEIREEAFLGTAEKALVIPEGVRFIGPKAFAENRNLIKIQMPEDIDELADDAF